MAEWKEISPKEAAEKSNQTLYEVYKERSITKDGKYPVVDRFPKREKRKQKIIFEIVKNLPVTLLVLHKRTGYTKTDLKRYLKKLVEVEAVKREYDMYVLNTDWVSPNHSISKRFLEVWNRWVSNLPEYAIPTVNNPCPKGSAVRLAIKGQKIDEHSRAIGEKRSVKRYKKQTEGKKK